MQYRIAKVVVWRVLLTASLSLALAACALKGTIRKPGLEYDQYAGQWTYDGDLVTNAGSFWGSAFSGVQINAWMHGTFDKTGQNRNIQLYVMYTGNGAGRLIAVSASDSTGTKLVTHRVENTAVQTLGGTNYYAPKEVVAIELPRRFLEERRSQGLDIQLRGYENTTSVIKVPPDYVANYLAGYDRALSQHPGQ